MEHDAIERKSTGSLLGRIGPVLAALGLGMVAVPPAGASGMSPEAAASLPLWSVTPFALLLLAIAILPLTAPHWWESNRNKALLSVILGVPMAVWMGMLDLHHLGEVAEEYSSFILLLGALYVIAGGVKIEGAPAGTPLVNTGTLAVGAILASIIGTTGAAMVLIRPLLRANARRRRRAHIIFFFILLVANIGGSLTPLGDPPLFLGYLRGVPFFWTLNLVLPWCLGLGYLLVLFHFVDEWFFDREDLATPGSLIEDVQPRGRMRIEGKINLLLLAGVVFVAFASGTYRWPFGVREAALVGLVLASLRWTRKGLRQENEFTWHPIEEVAILFAGIFAAMIPALAILNARGSDLGISQPWQFFWATGLLSGFLDNAPTYLTFLSLAQGLNLPAEVPGVKIPHLVLSAISVGAVFMGANTYIGNGPNFMVKAIAERSGVRMPSFFAFFGWAMLVLTPLYVAITLIFYR